MNKKVMFAIACGLTASLAHAALYTSTKTGGLNLADSWTAAVPVIGDTNEWLINTAGQTRTAAAATTFYGQTLTVQAGNLRPSIVAAAALTMNNLVLNGGTITTHDNGTASGSFTIDLSQDGSAGTFTLNSGIIKTQDKAGSQVIFRNGVLAGSGTINIEKTGTATAPRVGFENTINTVGFTGVFNVTGVLELPTISVANASFGLTINGGKLYNTANIAVTSLTLGTDVIAGGDYTAADLVGMNAGYAAYFNDAADDTHMITVIPEPAALGMVGVGAFLMLMVRRLVA